MLDEPASRGITSSSPPFSPISAPRLFDLIEAVAAPFPQRFASFAVGQTDDEDLVAAPRIQRDGTTAPPYEVGRVGADHEHRFLSIRHCSEPPALIPKHTLFATATGTEGMNITPFAIAFAMVRPLGPPESHDLLPCEPSYATPISGTA